MFTGIIEEIGTVSALDRGSNSITLEIKCNMVLKKTLLGDSICTNGVCLTVTSLGKDFFKSTVMGETLSKSNLGELSIHSKVNLERALTLDKRLGGHIVSGHIDDVGKIVSITRDDIAYRVEISAKDNILKYIISKGSITIDGISLTVAELLDSTFIVSIIPHTSEMTTLLTKKINDTVNLECDILGKYVERLLTFKERSKSNITMDYLKANGFM